MDPHTRFRIARVRALALRGMVAAGGRPTRAQLARVVAPVAGLLAPWEPAGSGFDSTVEEDVDRSRRERRKRTRVRRVFT